MKHNIKNFFKKILPKSLWNFLRHHRAILRDRATNFGSAQCHIPYRGYDLCYTAGTILIKKIRNEKIFEEKMCKAIEAELSLHNQPVFADIGANIGLISLYILSKLPQARIYAFEPGPSQNEQFRRTIARNGLEKSVTLSNYALGEKSGTVNFFTHFSPDSSGDGFMDTGRAGEPISITVPMISFDEWWAKTGKPRISVMKIDTEGAELLVLRGASHVLKELRPVIYLEIEPKNLRVYSYSRNDILKWFFEDHAYTLHTLDGELCTTENFEKFIGHYDTYVARPKI